MGADLSPIRPSGLARIMACPGSRRMEARMPDKPSSSYASEGTAAHTLAETSLRLRIGPMEWRNQPIEVDGTHIQVTDEMIAAVITYVGSVILDRHHHRLAKVWLEHRMWLREIENAGTVDCLLIDDNLIRVRDYKHGSGVYVSEVWNPQMLAYALAAWNIYGSGIPERVTVETVVHQPRFPGTAPERPFRITAAQLLRWRDEKLLPAVEASAAPDAPLVAGDHCMFCAAKTACMVYLMAPKPQRQRVHATPVTSPVGFDF